MSKKKSLYQTIEDDPELRAKEKELQNLSLRRAHIDLAMRDGEISQANGQAELTELESKDREARKGPVYERYCQVCREDTREVIQRLSKERRK